MFFPRRRHYFSYSLNKEVREIYWNASIFNLALSMAYIFEPIFLYKLGYSLIQILWFYLAVYVAYVVFIIPVTKITSRIGYKHAILISSFFYILYWFFLYQLNFHISFIYFLPILLGLQKSFFWPPYHADIATHSEKLQEGREVGVLLSLVELASIAGPFLGGAISYLFGFKLLFATSGLLMLLSAYPLFKTADYYALHAFRFSNFWRILKRQKGNFFGYWGYAEDLMIMTFWPIYVFLVIPNFFSIGLIATVASLIAVVLMLYWGRLADRFDKELLIKLGAVYYCLVWLLRGLAHSFWSVFAIDSLGRTAKGMVNVPMVSMTYDMAGSREPDYAMAYVVFYELSLSVGKVVTALAAILLLTWTSNLYYVFILTGALTLFYGLLRKQR